jgi:predicted DNA binding protein
MYVEFYSDGEVLQTTLRRVDEINITVHELATGGDTSFRLFLVVTGDCLGEFERCLETDDTVVGYDRLNDNAGERMYQVNAVPGTVDQQMYEAAIDIGGVYHSSTNVDGAWYTKMNFPDRESFRVFQAATNECGGNIQPTIIRDEKFFLPNRVFGLTEKQREVISEAVKGGYFEVPRGSSLSEIADRVDISDQAASERIRRALRTIAETGVSSALDESDNRVRGD